jgi:hypothetical protein
MAESTATCSRWFLARGFFYPEDGGDTFLRNVGSHKSYTAPHPEDGILHSRRCENLKSYITINFSRRRTELHGVALNTTN